MRLCVTEIGGMCWITRLDGYLQDHVLIWNKKKIVIVVGYLVDVLFIPNNIFIVEDVFVFT